MCKLCAPRDAAAFVSVSTPQFLLFIPSQLLNSLLRINTIRQHVYYYKSESVGT